MPQDRGSADVEIDLPLHDVFEPWLRCETYPLFIASAVEVVQLSSTVFRWKVAFEGRELEFDAMTLERVPQRRLAWRSLGPRVHAGSVSFEALGERRTRVGLLMEWDHRLLSDTVPQHALTCDARVRADLDVFARKLQEGSLGGLSPRMIG